MMEDVVCKIQRAHEIVHSNDHPPRYTEFASLASEVSSLTNGEIQIHSSHNLLIVQIAIPYNKLSVHISRVADIVFSQNEDYTKTVYKSRIF